MNVYFAFDSKVKGSLAIKIDSDTARLVATCEVIKRDLAFFLRGSYSDGLVFCEFMDRADSVLWCL